MKRALGSHLALIAALGISSVVHPTAAQAVQFDQLEISDPSRFVIMAAPIGNTGSHKLLIFEQLNNRRLCWREIGNNPTIVEPLFLEFDFTGICGRSTDSNAYSVRVAGEDLGKRYNLRLARQQNELVLIGFSLTDREVEFFEIGRTNGLTDGFLKINLDPNWRLTRRSHQGRAVGHLYFTSDRNLRELAKNAAPLLPVSPSPRLPQPQTPEPSPTSPPTQTVPGSDTVPPAPTLPPAIENQPTPSGANPVNPLPPVTQPPPPASGEFIAPNPVPIAPEVIAPTEVQPSPTPAPTNPPGNYVVPTTPSNSVPNNSVPSNSAPSAAPKSLSSGKSNVSQTPVVIPVTNPLRGTPTSNPNNFAGTGYRVVVYAITPEQQSQVRQLVPSAFRTMVNGQTAMQVGVFRDRAIANSLQQQLVAQNLNAQILPTSINFATLPANSAPITNALPPRFVGTFNLPEPNNATLAQLPSLWATYYYTHQAQAAASGYPLLDPAGNNLGVTLSQRDWCAAALEGSVRVANGQQILGTFNFAGRGDTAQVDCSAFYPRLKTLSATNRVRFKLSNTPYGEGVGGNQLVPYRTIAVDKTVIPIGSVVYIPEARGTVVTLPSGQQVVHDGYFYAADVGAAVKENHIDVYLGVAERNPFRFVQSTASATFTAYLINDPQIQTTLASQHRFSGVAQR